MSRKASTALLVPRASMGGGEHLQPGDQMLVCFPMDVQNTRSVFGALLDVTAKGDKVKHMKKQGRVRDWAADLTHHMKQQFDTVV